MFKPVGDVFKLLDWIGRQANLWLIAIDNINLGLTHPVIAEQVNLILSKRLQKPGRLLKIVGEVGVSLHQRQSELNRIALRHEIAGILQYALIAQAGEHFVVRIIDDFEIEIDQLQLGQN